MVKRNFRRKASSQNIFYNGLKHIKGSWPIVKATRPPLCKSPLFSLQILSHAEWTVNTWPTFMTSLWADVVLQCNSLLNHHSGILCIQVLSTFCTAAPLRVRPLSYYQIGLGYLTKGQRPRTIPRCRFGHISFIAQPEHS